MFQADINWAFFFFQVFVWTSRKSDEFDTNGKCTCIQCNSGTGKVSTCNIPVTVNLPGTPQ